MTLDTLYKRTKTGAIQQWEIGAHKSIQDGQSIGVIVVFQGQVCGKLQRYEEKVLQGKNIGKSNETTPWEQASSEAISRWNKKKDQGYKSLEQLGLGHVPVVSADMLDAALPKYNSDAQGNVKPMLAKAYVKGKTKLPSESTGFMMQPKLDGVRCLAAVRDGEVMFLSRSGKEYTTLDHLKPAFIALWQRYGDFVMDGEVYSHALTFQQITQAVKKLVNNSYILQFRAYDLLEAGTQEDRWTELVRMLSACPSTAISLVPTRWGFTKTDIEEFHQECVLQGYEGCMLRLPWGTYEQGFRSSSLLKVKEFNDSEFSFSHFETGAREEDLIAVCKHEGKEFKAKMMGSKSDKETLRQTYGQRAYETSDLVITVKHFGWTDDGLPRFPIGIAIRDYE